MSSMEWTQASLLIGNGELAIRRITDIAIPYFLVSVYGCRDLVF